MTPQSLPSRRDFSQDEGYVPFSNGTEHMMWLESNCCRGEKGCRKYRPDASSSRDGCPIEVAVALAGKPVEWETSDDA